MPTSTACARMFILYTSIFLLGVSAETRVYDFNIGWVNRNPDHRHERRVIAINEQWPLPTIEATVGDRLIINAHNNLGDQPTSLHFHGLFQNGTTHMDGAIGATQCPIPPGGVMTYDFVVDQPGTYWYHSHETAQYPDGLRGALIIHDPENPYAHLYDEEIVLTLSDWYHDEMPEIMEKFLSVTNPTGAEPVPQSALQNDTPDLKIPVKPGKTYFLRIVNVGAFAGQYLWIEGHKLTIIELDGVYHEPKETEMIYLSAAQRMGVLLTTKNETSQNFAIVAAMDQELFDVIPDDLSPNSTSYLVYDSTKKLPAPKITDEFNPIDDMDLVPYDHEPIFEDPAQTITLDVIMDNLGDGANYAFFNNITYRKPVVPTLYTVLSANSTYATNPNIYGSHTNSFILEQNQVIEIVLNNKDDGKHPFHLHGHSFQVITRSEDDAGEFDPVENSGNFNQVPMRRDTVLLRPNGHLVIRFRSDNPGVWQFHCHVEWHIKQGLVMTLIEAPLSLQENLVIPQDHLDVCNAADIPTTGNAAGNTIDWLDLTGQNAPPAPLPAGFTRRGVIALLFSIFNGILGTVVIFWYSRGDSEIAPEEEEGLDTNGDGEDEEDEDDENRNGGGEGSVKSRIPDETVSLLRH